jgi:ATP-binding cassette subfamily F protein 3
MAVLLDIKNASKRYGDQVLLDAASATITDDGKVGFIGRNGAGKSTLLRVILGEEELDSGEVIRHPRLRLGYLRQHDPFEPGETALAFLMRDSGQPDWKCGEVAGQFELKGDYLDGPLAKLSGGWQTRVKLAALLARVLVAFFQNTSAITSMIWDSDSRESISRIKSLPNPVASGFS